MNEPNTPSNQSESQAPRKMSSRATNFLMMGANPPKTGSDIAAAEYGEQGDPHYPQQNAEAHHYQADPAPPANEAPPAARQTGVISYERHAAERPGNTAPVETSSPQSAARTNHLASNDAPPRDTAPDLSPAERARRKEEKIDKMADRITDVLKKISDIKTGMLNPDVRASMKFQMMAEQSPAFSKFLAILLTQLEPVLLLVQRINQKLVEKDLVQRKKTAPLPADEQDAEALPPPPPEKVSFVELAEKNIIFCDNRKRPLYNIEQMRDKYGRTASEEVLSPMIMERIIQAFHEVAPKAKAIPTPSTGIYTNIPMNEVMERISEEEVMRFLNYVQRFPRGYVGKNFRITESFAGWVVSGTPDD